MSRTPLASCWRQTIANPQVSLARVIAAGLDGIERRLTLPAVTVDPHTLAESERQKISADRLPSSLKQAIQSLKQDDVFLTPSASALPRPTLP